MQRGTQQGGYEAQMTNTETGTAVAAAMMTKRETAKTVKGLYRHLVGLGLGRDGKWMTLCRSCVAQIRHEGTYISDCFNKGLTKTQVGSKCDRCGAVLAESAASNG